MISIHFDGDMGGKIADFALAIEQGTDELLEVIGLEMQALVMEDFETKSRGGTGEAGIKWAPLSQATIDRKAKRAKGKSKATQIGVDTGLMRSTIQPLISGERTPETVFAISHNEVTIGFGRKYSTYFDERRPLIPEDPPQTWIDAAEDIAAKWLGETWEKSVGE